MPVAVLIDMTGRRVGTFTVLSLGGTAVGGNRLWLCRCDCGLEKEIRGTDLRRGRVSTSCICQKREHGKRLGKLSLVHGMSSHPLYHTWSGMIDRCSNPNCRDYPNYGARGIYVCKRWQGPKGLLRFIEDMGDRPSTRHSIDRINNDGPYKKTNCRWATHEQQAANRRPPAKPRPR
jgi:hypothetical protein